MNFSQFVSILRARWKIAALVLLLTVGTVVTISLLLPRKYTATAAILVDMKSADPIAGIAGTLGTGYVATQADIIMSDRVAQKVVRDLKLTQNAATRAQWMDQTGGAGTFDSWLANALQASLEVKPSRESNVIYVAFTSPEPKFSAAIANAFVQAYLDTTVDLRVDPAKQYSSFFNSRSKELRDQLEKAQNKLSAYQKDNGILATDERYDVESARLNELSSQLVAVQALSAESGSRQAQALKSADQLSDVISNPVVAGLRADMSRQEAKLQEVSARYGDAHPQVIELKANIEELRARLAAETRRVSKSVGINDNINKSREGEIRASMEAQRARVVKLKGQRDEALLLQRDVDSAQRAYDAVATRLTQSSLESQTTQTNVASLSPATEPTRHSSPKLALNTLLAIFVGTMFAVATALLREMFDRRLRSAQDAVLALGVPVLGQLPRPLRNRLLGGKPRFVVPGRVVSRLPRAQNTA
jgi:chain length determinant protein EpsF